MQAGELCWNALETHFDNFFGEMATLEGVMDSNQDSTKAAILSECDQLRQQVAGMDHQIQGVQDETGQLTAANLDLAREIAELNEELEILKMRLTAL